MSLTFNIIVGGPLTGAVFNSARALGPMIATGTLSNAWLYVAAPIVGALFAAMAGTIGAVFLRPAPGLTSSEPAMATH